jgi:hypothetical protein
VHPLDFIGDGDEFLMFAAVYHVGVIDAFKRAVRRDGDDVESGDDGDGGAV